MSARERTYVLIAAMGFVGASLRYVVEETFGGSGFPLATWGINMVGCFAIEIVNDYIGRRLHLGAATTRAMGVGMVGAFTTLSAFTNETLELIVQGEVALAAGYVAVTLVGCFLAALAGHYAAGGLAAVRLRRLRRARARRRELVQDSRREPAQGQQRGQWDPAQAGRCERREPAQESQRGRESEHNAGRPNQQGGGR